MQVRYQRKKNGEREQEIEESEKEAENKTEKEKGKKNKEKKIGDKEAERCGKKKVVKITTKRIKTRHKSISNTMYRNKILSVTYRISLEFMLVMQCHDPR